jgi:HAD superfamily hydrolase (TIGR01484 family)
MNLGNRFLFASDLNGTLLPDTGAPPEPGCQERTSELLCALHEAGCPICYVTGGPLFQAQQEASLFQLPFPTWWVCHAGTELYDRHGKPDPEWQWRFRLPLDRLVLRRALRGISRLVMQEDSKQAAHKLSFYSPEPVSKEVRQDIAERLGTTGYDLQLAVGVEAGTGRGLLDIIPAQAGTARAVRHLAGGYFLPVRRVFFAGDSGADLEVLLSGVSGTLVGNADPEVWQEARRLGAGRGGARLYPAEGYYGDGVIEGLGHYGLWPPRG